MVDIATNIVINAPLAIVSKYAANPDNAPEWYKNIKSVEWKTPRPLTIGSRIAFKAKFLGKELSYRYEIKVYEPGQQLVMQTAEGPFPMKTIYTWRTYNDHACTMTLRNVGEPSGFSRLFAPFMKLAMKRANANDLKLLESILEQQNF